MDKKLKLKTMSIGKRYLNFLHRSIFSAPDDIERPYHKIVNFTLKVISIVLIVSGLWLNMAAFNLYIIKTHGLIFDSGLEQTISSRLTSALIFPLFSLNTLESGKEPNIKTASGNWTVSDRTNENSIFGQIISVSLFGISFILVGISIGLVLLVRYVAFTLPDRIFIRFNKNSSHKEI